MLENNPKSIYFKRIVEVWRTIDILEIKDFFFWFENMQKEGVNKRGGHDSQ